VRHPSIPMERSIPISGGRDAVGSFVVLILVTVSLLVVGRVVKEEAGRAEVEERQEGPGHRPVSNPKETLILIDG
jgi:hypothetical protein